MQLTCYQRVSNKDEEDKYIVIYLSSYSSSHNKSEINGDDKIKFVNSENYFNLKYITL